MHTITPLVLGGARLVQAFLPDNSGLVHHVELPAELSTLTRLTYLDLLLNPIVGGFGCLLHQLLELDLSDCSLGEVPAELTALTQLKKLHIGNRIDGGDDYNEIKRGWERLPCQLRALDLCWCSLQELPDLAGLSHLTWLDVSGTFIEGDFGRLPLQLQELDLAACGLRKVPAELSRLTQLKELSLSVNDDAGGWGRLPRQLLELDLRSCGLQEVPSELSTLTQLSTLSLADNSIEGGFDRLPLQLQELDLEGCGLPQPPPELAGRGLEMTGI